MMQPDYKHKSNHDNPLLRTHQGHSQPNSNLWDFPDGAVVKNPPANVGDMGSIPGPGRSHMPRSN